MHCRANATIDTMQIVPRLYENFEPNSYKLSILIDRKNRMFEGLVIIEGKAKNTLKDLVLHSKDLEIKSIVVDGKSASFSYGDNDELIIDGSNLLFNEHIIVIDFTSKITDSMHGMYPCYYEHDGKKKELIATQFESHHAREVFPCIDEPEAKATFDVTLSTEQNVVVLGNMPIKNQADEDDRLITTFETTPIMSTYLLAWVIGDLQKKSTKTKTGVVVNVWSTIAQPMNNLDFALDSATRSIEFFDEYFDTPYPLSKCDHVALPDFGSGAMENWGLITYREIALLVDPSITSIANKRYVATVIAHELSHQWFGNLVTMKWWNDLWLNESFASLIEYSAIDAIEPDWNIWLDFASYDGVISLKRDSLDGVQPVQTDVNHPDEIGTLFDGAIVYAKGARLLNMLKFYIGDDAFRSGLKEYFKIFAYKNTEACDLWSVLSKHSGKNIADFMTKWIKQPGFPVLHVSDNNGVISITQERLSTKKKSDSIWPITLNSNYHEIPKILDEKSISIKINVKSPIRFNVGNNAHFITHYDKFMLGRIIDQLENNELNSIDRLQLLNEQNLLANAGIISYADLVKLLYSYRNESEESVWDIIAMTIGELKKFVELDCDSDNKLRNFVKIIALKQYERLGWKPIPNEPEADTKLRSTIISLMVYSDDSEVLKTAFNIYKSNTLEEIDSELRSIILSSVVRNDDDDSTIDFLLKEYAKTSSCEIKQDINIGLTATKNEDTIKLLLDTVKNTEIIRTQDTARWIAYLLRNKFSRQQTWDWIQNNWSWIDKTFNSDKSYDDYPRYAATTLSTHRQLKEYSKFFENLKSDPALTRAINIGINEITNRVNSIKRDSEAVRKELNNF